MAVPVSAEPTTARKPAAPRPPWLVGGLVLAAVAGGGLIAGAVVGAPSPPAGPDAAAAGLVRPSGGPAGGLSRSRPTRIDIPDAEVHAPVEAEGLDDGATLKVPSLNAPQKTGWFSGGPAPGQAGPAVIAGHVDSRRTGPAVFYQLGGLDPGDRIAVTRSDHEVVVFRVDGVRTYGKSAFPTTTVYGPVPTPVLRLITCGGPFDASEGSYRDNVVVFATMVSHHRQTADEAAVPLRSYPPRSRR